MKVFDWIARISFGIGIVIILLGAIQIFIGWAIYPVANASTIFLAAISFFLITIILFLHNIKHKKE